MIIPTIGASHVLTYGIVVRHQRPRAYLSVDDLFAGRPPHSGNRGESRPTLISPTVTSPPTLISQKKKRLRPDQTPTIAILWTLPLSSSHIAPHLDTAFE